MSEENVRFLSQSTDDYKPIRAKDFVGQRWAITTGTIKAEYKDLDEDTEK